MLLIIINIGSFLNKNSLFVQIVINYCFVNKNLLGIKECLWPFYFKMNPKTGYCRDNIKVIMQNEDYFLFCKQSFVNRIQIDACTQSQLLEDRGKVNVVS